ncbi:MAG: hypothetical protein CBC42_06010 [Betaproteobacteria bacterium TMED82]|nr:MAG: hypothetical protein CBC42_06010 [Betaproteobacteria bacterium TMED82]|tara:strand:- start:48598 stop:49683 length:1086 start_codon:yes stop_codon:yes gene_type:complete
MAEENKEEQENDEFVTPEEELEQDAMPSQDKIEAQVKAAADAAQTVAEASEIIKSQEEAYANRRTEEDKRWEEQEKKRGEAEEEASKRLETLASTVLDAAEVANRSASSVTSSHKTLQNSVKAINRAAGIGNTRSTIVVSITVAVLVATAGLFGLVVFQMDKKMDQIELMVVNMGTRSAELKNSLAGVNEVSEQLVKIENAFDAVKKSNGILSEKMGELVKIAEKDKGEQVKLLADQTKKTNEESLKSVEKMITSVAALEKSITATIKNQEGSFKKQGQVTKSLANEVKKFEKKIDKKLQMAIEKAETLQKTALELTKVKSEIEALITLQRERYLEALEAADPVKQNNQMIKYPAKVSSTN